MKCCAVVVEKHPSRRHKTHYAGFVAAPCLITNIFEGRLGASTVPSVSSNSFTACQVSQSRGMHWRHIGTGKTHQFLSIEMNRVSPLIVS